MESLAVATTGRSGRPHLSTTSRLILRRWQEPETHFGLSETLEMFGRLPFRTPLLPTNPPANASIAWSGGQSNERLGSGVQKRKTPRGAGFSLKLRLEPIKTTYCRSCSCWPSGAHVDIAVD